jgi:hypothetical protein
LETEPAVDDALGGVTTLAVVFGAGLCDRLWLRRWLTEAGFEVLAEDVAWRPRV